MIPSPEPSTFNCPTLTRHLLLWFSVFLLCFLFYFESMPLYVSSRFSVSPVCSSLCVFPLHYLTCPLPSSLTSPVPRLVISVSVFGLCPPSCLLLCLNSGSASFGGAFEGQLCHNAAWRLSQSEGSYKCSPQMEDARLLSFVASHIPTFFSEKEERKREKGDIAWRRSSLLQAWVAEIVMQGSNIWWHNQEIVQRLDRPI